MTNGIIVQWVIPNKHNRCMSGDILKSPSNFNFNQLENLCPKVVHSCNFLQGLLHIITYLPANMESKRSLEWCPIATLANTGGFLDRFFHGATYLRFLLQKDIILEQFIMK